MFLALQVSSTASGEGVATKARNPFGLALKGLTRCVLYVQRRAYSDYAGRLAHYWGCRMLQAYPDD